VSEHVLVLRTCNADMTSHGGFKWPESGLVEAPDWRDDGKCGGGLHGLLWGEGNGALLNWSEGVKWIVCRVPAADIRELRGKVKFPRCEVVFVGDRFSATKYLSENGAAARAIVGGTATAGYGGTATAGYRGTATAGEYGTATAGYRGTATAGDYGTATAGDRGTATAGYRGIIQIRHWDGSRYRIVTGYVGEDGIEANKAYRLDGNGKFIEAAE
jgi:hypothetical protein